MMNRPWSVVRIAGWSLTGYGLSVGLLWWFWEAQVAAMAAVGLAAGMAVLAVVRLFASMAVLAAVADEIAEGRPEQAPRRWAVAETERVSLALDRVRVELRRRIEETEVGRRSLEVALAAFPQGVVLVEADDRVSFANPAARALLGPVPDRLTAVTPWALQRLVPEARAGGAAVDVDVDPGRADRWWRAVATPFGEGDRRVLLVVADVSEQRRMDSMRRQFVADASHELKTPVAAILASTETLRMALERDSAKALEFAARAEESARQLARIVADLLDLSRLEASEVDATELRLDLVVTEEVNRVRARAEKERIRIELDLSPVTVRGSGHDLGLAARNLIDNALRYSERLGTVTVRVSGDGGRAALEVADTGAGIPTRALPRVFERFYRVDVARSRATGGTGLGLAIVKHVAERHGGSVSVRSELGVGSSFRIELPI